MRNSCSDQSFIRVYITETKEVFEFRNGQIKETHRYIFAYGECLALLAEDWETEDTHLIKQLEVDLHNTGKPIWSEFRMVHNPFFYVLAMTLLSHPYSDRGVYAAITSFCEQLKRIRADARVLLSDCLSTKTDMISRRYIELWNTDALTLPHIRFERIPMHALDHSGSSVIADANYSCYMGICMELGAVCYPRTVQELYDFLKFIYLRRAVRFKRCRLCGKLFAAVDGERTEYCRRKYSGKKACRDIGAARVYQKKILSNPITRAYNRAYKTHNARIRYGTMTREEFQTWVAEAKRLRDVCQSGNISLDCFEEWLKQ